MSSADRRRLPAATPSPRTRSSHTIVLAYDGSPDAHAAVERAGRLMPGAEAVVLSVWEPLLETLTRTGALGLTMGGGAFEDTDQIDLRARTATESMAA